MKEMKKRWGLLVLVSCVLAGFLFTSCEKESTELNMIVKKWTLVSKTVGALNMTSDCEKDSKWDFKSDGSYVIKDSCGDTKAGTWKLGDDGKTLTLDNITAYNVIENSIINLVIEMHVGKVDLVRWTFK